MKKLFWVNLILIILLFASCATSYTSQEQTEIVSLAIQLADKQVASEDYDSALETYSQALEAVQDYRLIYNKAIVLDLSNKSYEAAKLCFDASEKYPKQEEMFLSAAGKLFTKSNSYKQAKNVYEKLIELNPKDKEYRYQLAETLINLREEEQAYEVVLSLWNEKNLDFRTASLLYQLKPKEWKVVYQSFQYDAE